ncbi:lysylphosphatidylglycerol synthase transmembrane domain-containing protein [Lachnobacterium bovis]|uniref:Phosphatidylglycerol lysyltransferase n=1 Tax=Lachnobacterium bovis TaxID=140626 RepID=A0A1H9P639_9FIRM|nr:lysylphosphatidylglycerol synthase transmembrane domain-containing protein [Lachnobacterium bovis]SER43043.1 hypothetical protein SAMN02910429_00087 [Lachnobacterium bovis]
MRVSKKNVFNVVFLITVFALTLYGVFHGQDMGQILGCIKQCDIRYWMISILFVVFFVEGESVIIYYMMKKVGQNHVKFLHCILYSFVGFFFSCITPSATGGQPAQIYYMKKDKISIPIATVILMIVTITYKLVLVLLGVGVMIIRPEAVMNFLSPVLYWCYLGIALNCFCVGFMLLLVFHPTMAKKILFFGLDILVKLKFVKRREYHEERLNKSMQQYSEVAVFFQANKKVVFNVIIITIVQRFLLFFVTWLVYRSFGFKEHGANLIMVLQGMISVAVDMLPLPGGMGISEQLFLQIFAPIFKSYCLPGMIVSRGLSYYTELILSAILTIVAQLTIGRRKD